MTLERAITPTTGEGRPASRTVREAAFDVLRARGLTTMFANPQPGRDRRRGGARRGVRRAELTP